MEWHSAPNFRRWHKVLQEPPPFPPQAHSQRAGAFRFSPWLLVLDQACAVSRPVDSFALAHRRMLAAALLCPVAVPQRCSMRRGRMMGPCMFSPCCWGGLTDCCRAEEVFFYGWPLSGCWLSRAFSSGADDCEVGLMSHSALRMATVLGSWLMSTVLGSWVADGYNFGKLDDG